MSVNYSACRCGCAVFAGNICTEFEQGQNGRCAHCDHSPICHAEIRIDKALDMIRLNKVPETELLLKSAIKLLTV